MQHSAHTQKYVYIHVHVAKPCLYIATENCVQLEKCIIHYKYMKWPGLNMPYMQCLYIQIIIVVYYIVDI